MRRIEGVQTQIQGLGSRMDRLEGQFEQFTKRLDDLRSSMHIGFVVLVVWNTVVPFVEVSLTQPARPA
jgi:hypothetical protein